MHFGMGLNFVRATNTRRRLTFAPAHDSSIETLARNHSLRAQNPLTPGRLSRPTPHPRKLSASSNPAQYLRTGTMNPMGGR